MIVDIDDIDKEAYINSKEKFEEYYAKQIEPVLKEKERVRQKYVGQFWTLLLFSAFLFPMLIIAAFYFNRYQDMDINEGLFGILFFILIFIIRGPFARYKKTVKNDVMNVFINFFEGFKYGGKGMNIDDLRQSRLVPDFDHAYPDDCFEGVYQGVRINVSEELLTNDVQTRQGTREVTVFRGIVVEMDMNKTFKGETIALVDSGIFNFFRKFEGLENVKLEDVAFEKAFEIYSSDQVEARYLLTPALMERIFKLQKLFESKKISVGFKNQKITVAIDTQEDMFEPCSFFKTNVNKAKIDKVFEEFWTIFSMVHVLKLNQRI